MAYKGDVNVGLVLDALHVGKDRALVLRLVLVPAAGGNQLGERVEDHQPNAAVIFGLDVANGCNDLGNRLEFHQVDCFAHQGDRKVLQALPHGVGFDPSSHQVGALEGK